MGKKVVFALIAVIGYLIGMGVYVAIRLAIPYAIRNLNPWLIQNPWFLESALSGFAGAFVALSIAYLWSRSMTSY